LATIATLTTGDSKQRVVDEREEVDQQQLAERLLAQATEQGSTWSARAGR
jgi:hypothetical protein